MDTKKHFRGQISEAISEVIDDIPDGEKYDELLSIFEKECAVIALRRTGKAKLSAKRLGISDRRFRRMLKQ